MTDDTERPGDAPEPDDPPPNTAAADGRTDLDVPDPTEGYGLLPDVPDEELREAYREADPDPSTPVDPDRD